METMDLVYLMAFAMGLLGANLIVQMSLGSIKVKRESK